MTISTLNLSALSALIVLVAACSSGIEESDESVAEDFQTSEGTTGDADSSQERARLGEGELPVQTQLILGTLQLETTDLAVDSVQAAELALLWKAMRSLTTSDTAAAAEIEALLEQIQDIMTTEQLEAISAFEITPEDMRTIIQDLGIEFGSPEGFEGFDGEGFNPGQFGGQFGGGGGQGPGGQFGGGPGGFQGGGGDFDPEAFATQRAERGLEGFGGRAGGFLFDPLIELLEARAGLEDA
jgi:hypothetical protein